MVTNSLHFSERAKGNVPTAKSRTFTGHSAS